MLSGNTGYLAQGGASSYGLVLQMDAPVLLDRRYTRPIVGLRASDRENTDLSNAHERSHLAEHPDKLCTAQAHTHSGNRVDGTRGDQRADIRSSCALPT